jgi:hypothetical protein
MRCLSALKAIRDSHQPQPPTVDADADADADARLPQAADFR